MKYPAADLQQARDLCECFEEACCTFIPHFKIKVRDLPKNKEVEKLEDLVHPTEL